MEPSDMGFELESYLDPRVTTLVELNEARRALGATASARAATKQVQVGPRDSSDDDSGDATVEDLTPAVLPVAGIVGLVMATAVAVLTAGAVYAVRSVLH
jgi:hypothetical protein